MVTNYYNKYLKQLEVTSTIEAYKSKIDIEILETVSFKNRKKIKI